MNPKLRLRLVAAATVLLVGGAVAYAGVAFASYQARSTAPSAVDTTDAAPTTGDRIVFRNTASGAGYGMVAAVPMSDPSAARDVSDTACDRVYATTEFESCLRIDRGVVTTFSANLMDAEGAELRQWALPGIPSRTRISADSKLVAVTAFVTGESYGTVGFSTQTTISSTDGTDYGSLEDFALIVDGQQITAADRNLWGVTFADDDETFYATAASAGKTWLVKGDLSSRTLTAVRDTAECPSLSPDGSKVAYKKNSGSLTAPFWSIAVLDLATDAETILPEKRNVDDQVEWLDDDTLLYGMPREDAPGDTDVWSVAVDSSSAPAVFIEHAWSPSVVRA